jgi:glutathione S-transferase
VHDLILHHYPQSPVAEKVRKVLGLKGLAWRSVEIPRLPPKPDLMPLTGGYRLTPVLQIGADVYCDSQRIICEIDRRHPDPTLFPASGAGMPWALGRWTDGPLFKSVLGVVLGAQAKQLPPEFAADRGRLYFGPDVDYEAMERDVPHQLAQVRAQLGWVEARLATGRTFVLGEQPGLPDALVYYIVWFLRGRYAGGAALLEHFPNLLAWERRVDAVGHGSPSDLAAREALAIANAATPEPSAGVPNDDPQPLRAGQAVAVTSETDDGTAPIAGLLATLSMDEIAIRHHTPETGDVVVHFPRVGYRVAVA